jgi:hypothetical protein
MGMARPEPRRSRQFEAGQSIVEFSVLLPVLLLLAVAIADLGRLYVSAVAVEAAAREAADSGSFESSNWSPVNAATTTGMMEQRACVAAAGSHLEGYETTDPANNTCTNPAFHCSLELGVDLTDCASSGGVVGTTDCLLIPPADTPCTVHVRMEYDFKMLLGYAPLAGTIHITRDSRFRMQDLTPP